MSSKIRKCEFCGKDEDHCSCFNDEGDSDTIVPNDSTTNPAVWGGADD